MKDKSIEAFAKELLKKYNCDEDCYRGENIETIEYDLQQCFSCAPEHNPDNYSIHDIALCLRKMGDAIPPPLPKKYAMVFDGGDFVDSVKFDDLETAKNDAFDTLSEWMADCCVTYNMPADITQWTPFQINEWDSLISNCSCWVCEYNPKTGEYDKLWNLSSNDEKNIGWLYYEELLKIENN